jgi:hypothetical protein
VITPSSTVRSLADHLGDAEIANALAAVCTALRAAASQHSLQTPITSVTR